MSSYAQIRGRWVDVDTYLVLNDAGHRLATIDGGLFTLEAITLPDHNPALELDAFTHALIGFDQLVDQGFSIGDQLTIDGTIAARYLTTEQAFSQTSHRLATLRQRLASSAAVWGHKQVPRYRQAAWQQLNDALVKDQLSVSAWLINLRHLLFQERLPSPKFQRFATGLEPIISQMLQLLNHNTRHGLVVADVATVSGFSHAGPPPGEVPIYRDSIRADRPMRENYRQQWDALRQAAGVYQQTHPL